LNFFLPVSFYYYFDFQPFPFDRILWRSFVPINLVYVKWQFNDMQEYRISPLSCPPSPALVHQSVSPPPIFYTFLLCFCLLRSFCQRQTTYLLLGFSILIILYIHSFSHLHNVHSFAHLYIEPSRSRLYGS
jgi:hypothetical protein